MSKHIQDSLSLNKLKTVDLLLALHMKELLLQSTLGIFDVLQWWISATHVCHPARLSLPELTVCFQVTGTLQSS